MAALNQEYLKTMFAGITETMNRLIKLDAIRFGNERITKNDKVKVFGNFLIKSDQPTHQVIELYGNVSNTIFEVKALNLITGKEETIKL